MRFSIAVASTVFLAAVSAAPASTDEVTVRRGDPDDAALITDFNLATATLIARDDDEEEDDDEDDEEEDGMFGYPTAWSSNDDEEELDDDEEELYDDDNIDMSSLMNYTEINSTISARDMAAWSSRGDEDDEDDEQELDDADNVDMSSLMNYTEINSTISAREEVPVAHWNCNYGDWADRRWIEAETARLRQITWCGATARTSRTEGKCVRTGCTRGANIFLCNDRPYFLKVKCSAVADMVERLSKECNKFDGNFMSVRGQIFTKDNWNVIVKASNNC